MPQEITSFRINPELIERADALKDSVCEDPKYAHAFSGKKIFRSDVYRIAMEIGIAVLERKYTKKNG